MKPVIYKRRCSALESVCLAIPACPNGAIAYVEDDEEPLGGRIVIDYTLCDECGTCADECCGEAIKMEDESPSGAASAS
jgi:Pyruvate/2-oxoacid:ferredoxin oxidoreductase delta subunit